jgi:hypothetical protein
MGEETAMALYRQGDVLLVRVGGIIGKTVAVPRERGRLVLAHGEATGHAHVITAETASLVTAGQAEEMYLMVYGDEPVALTHEEHDAVRLSPGSYRVVRQREYQPDALPRYVAD